MPIDEPIKTDPTTSEDLSKQYQDVLDQYAKQLDSNPVPPEVPTPAEDTVSTEIPTPIETPIITEVPPPEPPAPTETFIPPEPSPLLIPPENPPHSNSAIPKILFFISLFTFLIVIAANLYVIYLNQKPISTPTKPTESTISPTPQVSSAQCALNDKKYNVAENFPAADGCNTCTCLEDLTITCTENACATVSPTSTSSAIPKDWKTYTNKTLGFSLKYPKDWTTNTSSDDGIVFSPPPLAGNHSISILNTKETLEGYISQLQKNNIDTKIDLNLKQTDTAINDIKGTRLTHATNMGIDLDVFFISSSKSNYLIKYHNSGLLDNQILSTFKFL